MELKDIINPANLVYAKPKLMNENAMHYCPGCSHGVIHKLIGEVIDEMGLEEKTIGIAPVGCGVFAYNYLDIDWQEAAHGRAPAIASAIKRLNPDKMVFTYQGDGDLAAIGTAETIHAANRGENIVIVFINNGIYGMTGGQMAPTTLEGMATSTTPNGRDISLNGYPIFWHSWMVLVWLPDRVYIRPGLLKKQRKCFARPSKMLWLIKGLLLSSLFLRAMPVGK
jgi:2-oxoglutarate/2-oxoacid ferredoxin oxidoreductase subunit beta